MIRIAFPRSNFRIKDDKTRQLIFDEYRKRWVTLTPEEWVRQNFLEYLVRVMQYPASMIAIEREIAVGDLRKRFDIVVYKNAEPWMIVECKEANVKLNDSVIQQILAYNTTLQVKFLVITNGSSTFCLHLNLREFNWMDELPGYN